MIHFIQPYSYTLNIGRAYNDACEGLTGWICIMDQDTLKFEGFAQRIRQITDGATKDQVITCRTNRLRRDNENVLHDHYWESDINVHFRIFHQLWEEHGAVLERTRMPIAGMCMIFHSSVWDQVKFTENAINFDSLFTTHCREAGFITYVAKGLYVFHLYRWNRDVGDTSHLIQSEDMINENLLLTLGKHKGMKIVKRDFYCIKTKRSYKKGDQYKGKRKDLEHVLLDVQEKKEAKVKTKEKVERKPRKKKLK